MAANIRNRISMQTNEKAQKGLVFFFLLVLNMGEGDGG